MAAHDPLVSPDDRLTSLLLRHYRAERRLKLVIAELRSMAAVLEDLAARLRGAPEGLCCASATARLNQFPSAERLLGLVQEARILRQDLLDLEREIPGDLAR